ncbi:tetratricopeptide repeat protein [Halodesulfovibrio aestuarii]
MRNKAIALYYIEQYSGAAECFIKAARLAKEDSNKNSKSRTEDWRQNHYQAAACFYKATKYAKARTAILPILSNKVSPSIAETLTLYAHIELALEHWKEAINALQRLITNAPNKAKSWKLLAEAYLRTDALKKAASTLQVAYSITAPTASEQTRLARIYLQIDAPLLACKTIQKIPSPITASQNMLLAIAYERSGDSKKAIIALQKAVALENNVKNNMELGKLLYRSCQYEQAITPLTLAANKTKKKGMAYYLIGQCFMHLKQLKKSKSFFNKALAYAEVKGSAQNALRMITQLSQTNHES